MIMLNFLLARLRTKVVKKIKKTDLKVLDMACGTGNQSIAFAKKGFEVIGIDLSLDMLKYARKKIKPKYQIEFIHGDATKIPFNDSTFDVSSVSFALHDMPEKIATMVLKEMIRTTKKNGQIIIVDYHTPKNKMIAWLGYKIPKRWESQYYDHFMNVGLNHYLKKVNLKPISKDTYLLGNFQIIECINNK